MLLFMARHVFYTQIKSSLLYSERLMDWIIAASFIIVPHESFYLPLLIGLVLILGGLTFGLRGIMYAQVNEINIPKAYTGTAMGFLICLGFSPEAYVHIIFGFLMDKLHENA